MKDGEGQGKLACCSPWGHKELDMTKWLNNNSEDDSGAWEKNVDNVWKDARNVYQRPKELRDKQAEMNNTLEGINSRITEAEERKNDPEERMVEITAREPSIGKKKKNEKKWRQPKRPLGQH